MSLWGRLGTSLGRGVSEGSRGPPQQAEAGGLRWAGQEGARAAAWAAEVVLEQNFLELGFWFFLFLIAVVFKNSVWILLLN